MSDNHPALPAPFPTRAFVAIGIVWVLIDLPVLLATVNEHLLSVSWMMNYLPYWLVVAAAKVMLLVGWLVLGEGTIVQRSAIFLVFAPLLSAVVIGKYDEPELVSGMFFFAFYASLVLPVLALPFLAARLSYIILTRNAPRISENKKQFTVRQLMLFTLLIAIALGSLRWIREAESLYPALQFFGGLFCWLYPMLALLGFLRVRFYPSALYALVATVFVIAIPLCLKQPAYGETMRVAGYNAIYLCFIAMHILLLRYFGYRLVFSCSPEIAYLNKLQTEPIPSPPSLGEEEGFE